jgi:hypothetical protein
MTSLLFASPLDVTAGLNRVLTQETKLTSHRVYSATIGYLAASSVDPTSCLILAPPADLESIPARQ